MAESYDLVVIGTGTAASVVARQCRNAGWTVAVADERPYGGTCPLRGCNPKKVLRRGAELVDGVRQLQGKGVNDPGLKIAWRDLMAFKKTFTDPVPEKREESLAKLGIATCKGHARFVGAQEVAVGDRQLEARNIVIATGARPMPLPFDGAEHLKSSDDFLELSELPERVLFVGGGYISFEFAHLAARADARVVMLEQGDRTLTYFDADLVDNLRARTEALGIELRLGAAVTAIEPRGDAFRVTAQIDGKEEAFETDLVVHGAGRVPNLDGLGLEAAGVAADKSGVAVNEWLQNPGNPAVYAAGDCVAKSAPPLTPVASLEAETVAANLIKGNHRRPDYTGVPSVVFTLPELVRVGMTEEEARDAGHDVACKTSDMRKWFSVRRVGETHAMAKVLVDRSSDRVLGAHILGPEASELANVFGLAMRAGIRAEYLRDHVSAYPSVLSDITALV